MHPLQSHHVRHLVSLLTSERRFLSLLEELQRFIPRLRPCLGGMESDSRQRLDCLRLFAVAQGIPPAGEATPRTLEEDLEDVFLSRGHTERQAFALRVCARRHRLLMNDYRIGRELAHRVGHRRQAERIDAVLAGMTDSFPLWKGPEALPGLVSMASCTAG